MKINRFLLLAASLLLAATYSFSQEPENKIRFGGRIANSSDFFVADDFGIRGMGVGFAVGGAASIPIISTITFNPELNLIYRAFSMEGEAFMTEFAISIPALFQFMPFGGPVFYLEAGFQLDIPLARKVIDGDEDGYYNSYDSSYHYYEGYYRYYYEDAFWGIPLGVGWHIGKHFVIDYRITIDLFAYAYGEGYGVPECNLGLLQSELGLLYLF